MYQLTDKKKRVYNLIDETAKIAQCIKGDYELIFYDTETTGKTKGSFPVQITAIKLRRNNGSAYQVVDRLNLYIKPPISVPEEVVAVHGLSDEFLADKPSEEEVFGQVKSFFGNIEDAENGPIILGYNSKGFDTKKIMDPYFKRCGELNGFVPAREYDVYTMAKELLSFSIMPKGEDGKPHMRLIDCATLYNITGESFHNAETDVEVTIKVCWALYNDYAHTFISYDWLSKPHIDITGSRKFNPNHYIDYTYFNVVIKDNAGNKLASGVVYYDKRNKKFIEDNGDIFGNGNMIQFEKEAMELIKAESKKKGAEKEVAA